MTAEFKNDTVNQIKNVEQKKDAKPEMQRKIDAEKQFSINSFQELLKVCTFEKELRLKYELEKNVNLIRFEKNIIEISFNDNLEKNFVKDLSLKLFEWTGERWIITLSKKKGEISIKDKRENEKMLFLKQSKNSELYKNVINKFSDAELIEVISNKKNED